MPDLAATLLDLIRTNRLVDGGCLPAMVDNPLEMLQALVDSDQVDKLSVLRLLADNFAMEVVDPALIVPDPMVLSRVGETLARRYRMLPYALHGDTLIVALANPLALNAVDTLAHRFSLTVEPRLAWAKDLDLAIDRAYAAVDSSRISETGRNTQNKSTPLVSPEVMESPLEEDVDSAPVEDYVNGLIHDAIRRRASDIHLEPMENRLQIRVRVDGELLPSKCPARHLQSAILSRVKLMAGISIAEKRLPQDGRIVVNQDGISYDLRVSSLASVYGETIVIRILNQAALRRGLPELGFLPEDRAKFEQLINLPDGMLLVTGPTGSGKTTTLYSVLHHLNQSDRKIITVEDPVEYQMQGINQVPVRPELGMTFASALRAMLRQSPNVIMVGEIRDRETAEIAVNASLTGHMVFSTLHTNDAPSAISRLIDIGVKPFLIAATLRAVLAQRLVRCVCTQCAQSHPPTATEYSLLSHPVEQGIAAKWVKGTGCEACQGTGYRGRIGVFELLTLNDTIREKITRRSSLHELRTAARELGMRTMRKDGLHKVRAGISTLAEVLANTPFDPE